MSTPRTTPARTDAADDRPPASPAAHRIDQLRDIAAAVIVAACNPWGKPESPEQTAAIESVTVPDFPTALYKAAFAFVVGEREDGAAAIRCGQLTDHLAAVGFVDEEVGVVEGWFSEVYTNVNVVRDVAALKDAALKLRLADLYHRAMTNAQNGSPLADVCAEAQSIADTAKAIRGNGYEVMAIADLIEKFPHLNRVIIDNLLRSCEVMNLIAAPKVGKSWLTYYIALCVVFGLPLWDTFACTAGRVLIVDYELHKPTIATRIKRVADAMGLDLRQCADRLDVLSLRGQRAPVDELRRRLRGRYDLVILDALYRALPKGVAENSNEGMADVYGELVAIAESMEAALIVVHHASKGNQSDKAITDVGAGAGAQARATDTHLILREHEEPGRVVLDAGVRSFPPVVPVGLKWDFPLWVADVAMDTSALKGRKTRGEARQDERDEDGMAAILAALDDGPMTTRQVRAAAGGLGKERGERLLDLLESTGKVRWEATEIRGGKGRLYRRA